MSIGRFGAGPLRGISALLLLGAVAAASLLAVLDALRVEGAADDLVANTRQVLHTAAAHEHDGVLLEVVALTRNVGGDLDPAGQTHTRDLTQGRVRLLRGGREHTRADATTLRGTLECGRLVLLDLVLPALPDQLLDRRHYFSGFCVPNGEANLERRRPTRSGVSNPADSRREAKRAQITVAAHSSPCGLKARTKARAHPRHKV